MAFEDKGKCVSMIAGSDFSSKQYYLVIAATSAAETAVLTSSSVGQAAIGIGQDDSTTGDTMEVMVGVGFSKCVQDGSLALGDLFVASSEGKATEASTGGAGVHRLGKVVLVDATSDGGMLTVLWQPTGAST